MNGQHKRTLLTVEYIVEALPALFPVAVSTQHLTVTASSLRVASSMAGVRVPDFICSAVIRGQKSESGSRSIYEIIKMYAIRDF